MNKKTEWVCGCLPDKKDLRDYKIKAGAASLPENFELTNLPAVKNQLNVGSCTAHAVSSVLEYFDNAQHVLSTNFIYGLQRQEFNDTTEGLSISHACKIVKKYGDMLESECKGNNKLPICCEIAEASFRNEEYRKHAYEYRIDSYFSCLTEKDIKYAIMKYGPVVGSMVWYHGYNYNKDTKIIEFDTKSKHGNHAVMIYGWTKDGWLIQNSYGEYLFNKGRFIMPYKYKLNYTKILVDHIPTDDEHVVIPVNNNVLDSIYKIVNSIINLFGNKK